MNMVDKTVRFSDGISLSKPNVAESLQSHQVGDFLDGSGATALYHVHALVSHHVTNNIIQISCGMMNENGCSKIQPMVSRPMGIEFWTSLFWSYMKFHGTKGRIT